MAKPKTPKAPLTPQQYYELPASKRSHALTMIYIGKCTEGFSKKALFSLRHYFGNKVSPSDQLVLYEYIFALPEPTVVSLYDLWDKARQYQGQLRLGSGKPEVVVEEYPSLLQCLKGI